MARDGNRVGGVCLDTQGGVWLGTDGGMWVVGMVEIWGYAGHCELGAWFGEGGLLGV